MVARAEFTPSRNGLRFANVFPHKPVEFVSEIPIGDASAGLAGGMVFTALDLFLAGENPPPESEPPAAGSARFEYLTAREMDSLDFGGAMIRYVELARGGAGGAERLAKEWQEIAKGLDEGPVPLGLAIRSKNDSGIGGNHQVLAYGYATTGNAVSLNVYDPNYPGDDTLLLQFELGAPTIAYSAVDSEVLGLFRLPYKPRDPGPWRPPPPPFSVRPSGLADVPAEEDSLGFKPIVDGLAALLNDPATSFPLAVAIAAPWGGGKSSVMRQLKHELTAPSVSFEDLPRWRTVWFPAWKFEHSERIWAALARSIYEDVQAQSSFAARMRFRSRLALRRARPGAAIRLGFQVIAAVVIAVIAGLAAATGMDAPSAATPVFVATGGALAIGRITLGLWQSVGPSFQGVLQGYVDGSRIASASDPSVDAQRDVSALLKVLSGKPAAPRPGRVDGAGTSSAPLAAAIFGRPRGGPGLAIFIDDLDRCAPANVVRVIEAVNGIIATIAEERGSRCVFILGMDREIIATSIETAYDPLVKALHNSKNPLATDYGTQFLAKMAQLTVELPDPLPEKLLGWLDKMKPPSASAGDVARQVEKIGPIANPSDVQAPGTPEAGRGLSTNERAAHDQALQIARARVLNVESKEVRDAEKAMIPLLDPNPRLVKRFLNAFVFQLQVANRMPTKLTFTPNELLVIGKWVALTLACPGLAERLDKDRDTLMKYESAVSNEDGRTPDEREAAVAALDADELACTPQVKRLLAWKQPEERLSSLPENVLQRIS